MPYSDRELREIERDPVRLRAWWWHMAQHHRRLAREYRHKSQSTGKWHPVTNYSYEFAKGRKDIRWANTLDRVSAMVLENIDALVESTLVK